MFVAFVFISSISFRPFLNFLTRRMKLFLAAGSIPPGPLAGAVVLRTPADIGGGRYDEGGGGDAIVSWNRKPSSATPADIAVAEGRAVSRSAMAKAILSSVSPLMENPMPAEDEEEVGREEPTLYPFGLVFV